MRGNLHRVFAWCEENRLVLGHVTGKGAAGSERVSIKQLLELLDIQGRTITIDALGCQREVAQKMADEDGDYVIARKQNQKNLLEDVKEYFKDREFFTVSQWEELDKGHGRIEKRSCWALPVDAYLKHHDWPHLKNIALVKCYSRNKETHNLRYYLSSLEANAETICKQQDAIGS